VLRRIQGTSTVGLSTACTTSGPSCIWGELTELGGAALTTVAVVCPLWCNRFDARRCDGLTIGYCFALLDHRLLQALADNRFRPTCPVPGRRRVVLEFDGIRHYADEDPRADPRRYA
jgi:hypothetical protein